MSNLMPASAHAAGARALLILTAKHVPEHRRTIATGERAGERSSIWVHWSAEAAPTALEQSRSTHTRRGRQLPCKAFKRREVVNYAELRTLQRKVFVGCGVRETGNETEARLGNARTDGIDKGELPDRRVDRPLMHYLLHLVQDRFPLGAIELNRLLPVERVDVGVGSIHEYAACDRLCLQPGSGVAESTRPCLDDIFKGLFGVGLEECDALNRSEPGPDADCPKTIQHGLGDIGVRGITIIVARVESFGITDFRKQLLRLVRIVDRRGRLPIEFEIVRNEGVATNQGIAEGERVVDVFAVDRKARRAAHALVMPGRFRIPLIGKVEAEWCLDDGRLEGQPR